MKELLKAIEAAIRRIVVEELEKKSNDFDFIGFIDNNAAVFDRAVYDGLENNPKFRELVTEAVTEFGIDKNAVTKIIDNYDFNDLMLEAAQKLTFTTEVSQH